MLKSAMPPRRTPLLSGLPSGGGDLPVLGQGSSPVEDRPEWAARTAVTRQEPAGDLRAPGGLLCFVVDRASGDRFHAVDLLYGVDFLGDSTCWRDFCGDADSFVVHQTQHC